MVMSYTATLKQGGGVQMIPVPYSVMNDYVIILRDREINPGQVEYYKKWLRYFYDFSERYLNTDDNAEKVRLFLEKLRSKQQKPAQCQQAAHAVALYFEMRRLKAATYSQEMKPDRQPSAPTKPALPPQPSEYQRKSQYVEAGYQEKSDSPEWDVILEAMAAEIKVRHYSRKTLKTYGKWSRCFQRFLKNKPPDEVGTVDVKEYLTFLAVKCHVAA
jgi:hypothetical protein